MPELPEVETVRRGLERTVVGKTVQSVEIVAAKIFPVSWDALDELLIGASVARVERRAKVLLITLSNQWTLAIHLKMTGQIIVVSPKPEVGGFVGGHPEAAYAEPLPHKHTHVTIQFTDGTMLYFNDLRKFGWMKLLAPEPTTGYVDRDSFLSSLRLGPEPLSEEFTLDYLRGVLRNRSTVVKSLLLDQAAIAGIGNIYADEALFLANVRPTRRAKTLTRKEQEKLYAAIRTVLTLGIEHGGTSMNTYVNVEGTAGRMRDHLRVYGREGEPCFVCGAPIERKKIGQRSSHYCLTCQR
ncbi:MAG: bifunctional DNA-formamidopyrimidine glycosylase/DNA-(apurinic or apyrimidinic site) lyase [Patescibacteria group bacterium]|jgi:formamidopyrimidine-DNA glycosylase